MKGLGHDWLYAPNTKRVIRPAFDIASLNAEMEDVDEIGRLIVNAPKTAAERDALLKENAQLAGDLDTMMRGFDAAQKSIIQLGELNAELLAVLQKHESRIRYAVEIGSELMLFGADLQEILDAIARATAQKEVPND
jgi:hypothetical protein